MKKVYRDKSSIHGIGIFAGDDFKMGDTIGVSHVYYSRYWYNTKYYGDYNHSEKSNCIVETTVSNLNLLIAYKDIKKGEELTADYRKQPYLEQPKEGWK